MEDRIARVISAVLTGGREGLFTAVILTAVPSLHSALLSSRLRSLEVLQGLL